MLADYIRLIVFAAGLLVGVQVPNFVDQYAKRVSAHQIEVSKDFQGFQQVANQAFGGSVEALIAHHAASTDLAFRNEAISIREMYQRLQALTAELAALQGPLIKQIIHIVFHPNREILRETRDAYSSTVPLNASSIICGVTVGAILALVIETLLVVAVRAVSPPLASRRR